MSGRTPVSMKKIIAVKQSVTGSKAHFREVDTASTVALKGESAAGSLSRGFAGPKQPGEYADVVEQGLYGGRFTRSVNLATGFDDDEFDTVSDHYLVAVLWTSQSDGDETPDGEDELDGSQSIHDFTGDTRAAVEKDLLTFLSENKDLIDQARKTGYGNDSGDGSGVLGQIGHDFWLTRNHEGAGFWDRDALRDGGLGDKLTEAAQKFGEQSAWAADGKVFIE